MRKYKRRAISLEINRRMIEHGFSRRACVNDWSRDLASASLTVEFDGSKEEGHQNMKTLFDLVDFFGAKPEDVMWEPNSYEEYGYTTTELHVHFTGVDLTRFSKKR